MHEMFSAFKGAQEGNLQNLNIDNIFNSALKTRYRYPKKILENKQRLQQIRVALTEYLKVAEMNKKAGS